MAHCEFSKGALASSSETAEEGEIIITLYLRLDKSKEGQQIPEDIRLMVEPRRKPADFLGVQLQVAANTGSNGSVPHMYAVFLCKGKGARPARLSARCVLTTTCGACMSW